MSDPEEWARAAESAVLDQAIQLAPGLGWSGQLTRRAAAEAGFSWAEAQLLLPEGPRDLAALLSRRHDAQAMAALAEIDPLTLKIRQRIRQGVAARLEAAGADAPAVRRWAGFLSLPTNLPLALRLVWESADGLWRWAGDTATDENHYSKRAILAGILVQTLATDLATGREAALALLDRRIDNVMAFEKWKAGIKPAAFAAEVAAALGALRYGRA